ncbi:MAG TPA: PAS domain S-box protein, partial [Steroidobacteraceae bacterium]|nr:PAS domain S-box protein [Steroidobacteraceae bacterium]
MTAADCQLDPHTRSQEDDARRAAAHLAAIVESSDDAIISKTLEGVIRSWNAGAERIFGWSAAEAIGRPITLIIPPDRLEEERHILDTLRRGERIEHFETTRVAKDGRHVEISLTVSPVRDAAGIVTGASKIARDITARKQEQRLLQEREEALREADRRKDEFLALLGHELRNPLAPIHNAAELLTRMVPEDSRARVAVDMIRRQAAQLTRLVDDLLDIGRITQGRIQLRLEALELASVIAQAFETIEPQLRQKRHKVAL